MNDGPDPQTALKFLLGRIEQDRDIQQVCHLWFARLPEPVLDLFATMPDHVFEVVVRVPMRELMREYRRGEYMYAGLMLFNAVITAWDLHAWGWWSALIMLPSWIISFYGWSRNQLINWLPKVNVRSATD